MKYEGPLYGKIGRKTFDTGKTSHDWDKLERECDHWRRKYLEMLKQKRAAKANK
jgi:hypothetical protein